MTDLLRRSEAYIGTVAQAASAAAMLLFGVPKNS
jgi:hypothetical protein